MLEKVLIAITFRLRNIDEFENIKKNFQKNGYVIIDIEVNRNEQFFERIDEIVDEIKENEQIVLITNIKDLLLVVYNKYIKRIGNFIFFVDRVNYNILRGDGEIGGDLREIIDTNIYININLDNYKSIMKFLLENINFYNFEKLNLESFFKNTEQKKEKVKNYNEKKTIKNSDLIIYQLLDTLRENEKNKAKDKIVLYLSTYKEKELQKEEIAQKILCADEINKITFKEKIELVSIVLFLELKNSSYFIEKILDIIIEDNGKNVKYYYHIINNILLSSGSTKNKNYYLKMNKVIKVMDNYYTEDLEEVMFIKGENKLIILTDSLQATTYSGTKFVLELAKIIKNKIGFDITICCEDNFFGIQEENLLLFDFNKNNVESSEIWKEDCVEYLNEENINFYYSDVNKAKKDRVKSILLHIKEVKPKLIITTSVYSNSINIFQNYVPTVYFSLGGLNFVNNFDLQVFPHLEDVIKEIERMGIKYEKNKLIEFNYNGNFKESDSIFDRESLGFSENEFIMITVGIWLKNELFQEYVDMICGFIRKYPNSKWIIVGEENIPTIDKVHSDLIDKNIFKIKRTDKLGAIYKICDIYLNPPRKGGGFSIAEAIINGVYVLSLENSTAGKLQCGVQNCSKDIVQYAKELLKVYTNREYRKEQYIKEKKWQESLKMDKQIDKIFNKIKEIIDY